MKDDEKIIEEMMILAYEKAKIPYSKRLINYGMHPSKSGTIDNPDGYARITTPEEKTVEMFLHIQDGKIVDARFRTNGCMFTTASCCAAAHLAIGKTLKECLMINKTAITEHLEAIPNNHRTAPLIAAVAFQKALRNFLSKNRQRI